MHNNIKSGFPSKHGKRTGKQSGLTLIEVLITLVIISVGLLGIAALQLISKQSSFESLQRSTATALASEILERMRANPNANALATYAGTQEAPSAPLDGTVFASEPTPVCSTADPCLPVAGNTANLANHDRWEFEQLLVGVTETSASGANVGGLVSPTLCITTQVPAANLNRSGLYAVTIVWRGQAKLKDNATTNTCGQGSANYESEDNPGSGDDAHRRILTVQHYIVEQIVE
ncbi:MAG: type IV pilus modification protein PilV [Gammaproteobacteria bacterium]|nr:type IV pilus modification protein PilV [Gammaproteobacteria bacterium]